MSLASTGARMYVGHEQAVGAGLTANGLSYRCYVWLSRVDWTIEARCVRVQGDGTEVDVFHNIIARASSAEIGDTNGVPLDSPKIIAIDQTFVVHWMQATDITVGDPVATRNWALHRSLMDMTAFDEDTWDHQGSVALLETHALYDVCPVIGSDPAEFVVARCTTLTQITVARYETPFSWVDTVWSVSFNTVDDVAAAVLGVYAHEGDDACVFTWQRTYDDGGFLRSARLDAIDGGSAAGPVTAFSEFEAAADTAEACATWVQISHRRVAEDRIAIVGEAQSALISTFITDVPTVDWIHHCVAGAFNTANCVLTSNELWCPNLSMASQLFSYASGTSATTPTTDIYCTFTYRSITEANDITVAGEWAQSYAYVCNLDYHLWGDYEHQELRPRPIVTITGNSIGYVDGRTSGWHPEALVGNGLVVHQAGPTKRRNHLPHAIAAPAYGPDIKTRTIPMTFFSELSTVSDLDGVGSGSPVQSVLPARAGIRGIVVVLEDPWTVFRDETDPEQPVANFTGTYPRAMHQCVPWGRGLFIAGGTPQLYDGEALVEVGFPWNPEIVGYNTGTFGSIANGTYSYYVCYSWVDRQGQIHRSAPSNIVTITLDSGDDEILLYVRCCNLSLKDATAFYARAGAINIEVYRTANGGSTYFRVFGSIQPGAGAIVDNRPEDTTINAPQQFAGYTSVLDGLPDTRLLLQGPGPYQYEIGSTTIQEPIPQVWPACHAPSLHQNRIVAADSLDPTRFIYSDENIPAAGAATYSAPLTGTNMQFRTGEIDETTGFQSLGPTLAQFTRDSVFLLNASAAGSGALNWTSSLLHDALGCVDPKSIVLFPLGIGFQSRKGYYVLARSGEASYGVLERSRDQPRSLAGAAIEDDLIEAGNIRAASHSPSEHRIDLVGNGRPTVTQTWTLEITVDGITGGLWTISGLSQTPLYLASASDDETVVATALAVRIEALVADDAPGTLQFEVASVNQVGNIIFVELLPDVAATLSGTGPGAGVVLATVAEEIETQPRVWRYHYDVEQWSRADLVQTNASNSRLSELVDGCYWNGDTGPRHVALAQGQLLLERLATDASAYADQDAVGLAGIPLDITTSWIHFGGIAGWTRTRRMAIVTERIEQDEINVTLEFDRDGSLTGQQIQPQTLSWPADGETVTPAYLKIPPREQRCGSVRLRIWENDDVTTDGQTCSIVALVFDVGVIPGMRRVGDAQIGS